ncbi:bifunctional diguanylate cyclase/phosphodiesterase [Pseudoalteromonas sp. SMS1]|uniref:putative bifunctional diguanylate cyclase/phosphodiesterase n=1 Tax=Pseudoalteromonas sp. SMS1 TaxID=2908894 RepID=UPI001F273AE2|nr:bifunctional diguanylate cyclase/phosphodiesterase [Pseudoalteromonas sp. SMS1]MCF2857271.1 bifunctional diguanylate cyclase/phosphodiesterase [Pseudoalteromonas sp. SMS1]
METLSLCLILVGLSFLVVSFKPAIEICRIAQASGWRVLFALICFFVLGYAGFAAYVYDSVDASHITFGLSTILALGGLFVIVVVNLSKASLTKLKKSVDLEKYNSQHDHLTQLRNRPQCFKCIEQRQRKDTRFSVVLYDLYNLKQINDAMGHFFGDKLLISFAQTLANSLLPGSELFRIGGDEFVVVSEARNESALFAQNNAILSALHNGLVVEEVAVDVIYSSGAIINIPEERTSASELLKRADIAMYAAKRSKQSLVLFDKALHQGVVSEFHMLNDFKSALARGDLTVFYQPIVDASSSKVHGVEALVRWPSDDGAYILPERFIPIAEKNNMIKYLSAYVINTVFSDLNILLKLNANLTVHINLSCQDLVGNNLINVLNSQIESKKVDPSRIIFELTESMVMTDVEQTKHLIEKLIDMGFSVSIDDFGTGFSSFSILKELPISQIKIDKSFVTKCLDQEKDRAIIETTLFLAKKLECSVVAEGVENDETSQYLTKQGCTYIQGFNISEPLSLGEVKGWITSSGVIHTALRKY